MTLNRTTLFLGSLAVACLAVLGAYASGAGTAPAAETAAGQAEMIPLQPIIDAAEENAIIELAPGVYQGPVTLEKPLTIDGGGKAIIDGGGKGTVVSLFTNGATIKSLIIQNSGDLHNDLDAGVHIEGDFNVVKDNIVRECLFGVDIQQADNNVVRRNKISSKADSGLGVKGDAIRLWYSKNNKVEDNEIFDSRDAVVWYSSDNTIARNKIRNGRYGLHFMYSKYNLVEGNEIRQNSVGIFLMYSDDVVVRGNRVFQALGPTGIGVGLKETSNVEITDNDILYNATGIYLDLSPFQPDTTNRIFRNRIAYNATGALFLSDWTNNIFKDNVFWNNIRQVGVGSFASAARNVWQGNYWDDYEGFDLDRDGTGDRPYAPKVYSDRLWMDVPPAGFFKGTPLLTALDFLERLAPFSDPLIMLKDQQPRISTQFEPATNAADNADAGSASGRVDPFGLHSD
ncbi:nitrous oxidase accessory protein [Rhodobium orientis]|uniref:Copper ABC transporter substrate-binding protein n=1 Tax=Rhodobium orientis TaxID=34017 RepID=A0A327JMH0_9HYPH|nr:nitrous oxide reductase family maturation protein NosD [Rhodobium orientis]MBB4304620.1 nitrous oxidase accessory protein [Rhodobium orientis]MBK5949995.1 copper ABC transporter substrate-binding protein [Rhodobium orientis]RAI27690.1 copper ABC transporter substrate-binding protein [Rhodobium orientis]